MHPQIEQDGLLHVWDDALPPDLCSELNTLFEDFDWHFDKQSQGPAAERTFTYARGEFWSVYPASAGVAAAEVAAAEQSGAAVGGAPAISRLWEALESLVRTRAPLARDREQLPPPLRRHQLRLARVYANGLNPTLDATAHYDDGDFTFMYYGVGAEEAVWRPAEGGETLFRADAGGRLIGGVPPRHNRIVAFDTALSHYAKAPSASFAAGGRGVGSGFGALRITLVLKATTTPAAKRSCAADRHEACGFWASVGYCEQNGGYMRDACRSSCEAACAAADEVPRYRWPRLQLRGGDHVSSLERLGLFRIWDGALSANASLTFEAALGGAAGFPWRWRALRGAGERGAGGGHAFWAPRAQLEVRAGRAVSELLRFVEAVVSSPGFPGPKLEISSVEAIGQNVNMDVWRPDAAGDPSPCWSLSPPLLAVEPPPLLPLEPPLCPWSPTPAALCGATPSECASVACRAPGGFSFVYYVLEGAQPWRDADGGETTFWNADGSRVLAGVMPRHNRLVGWNSAQVGGHMERGPSALCSQQLRRSILIHAQPVAAELKEGRQGSVSLLDDAQVNAQAADKGKSEL